MRGQSAFRQTLHVSGGEREKTLSNAWRRAGFGCSTRQQKRAEAWALYATRHRGTPAGAGFVAPSTHTDSTDQMIGHLSWALHLCRSAKVRSLRRFAPRGYPSRQNLPRHLAGAHRNSGLKDSRRRHDDPAGDPRPLPVDPPARLRNKAWRGRYWIVNRPLTLHFDSAAFHHNDNAANYRCRRLRSQPRRLSGLGQRRRHYPREASSGRAKAMPPFCLSAEPRELMPSTATGLTLIGLTKANARSCRSDGRLCGSSKIERPLSSQQTASPSIVAELARIAATALARSG